MRCALLGGWTQVDPTAYDGWDGHCPGCDVDVMNVYAATRKYSFDHATILLNAAGNRETVRSVFDMYSRMLKPNDLFLIYDSGHVGQNKDQDGDEADGLDEYFCWWDGRVYDDTVHDYLAMIPAGVRVLFVADTCHAEGMPRSAAPRTIARAVDDAVKAQIIYYGACQEQRSSYGSEAGGVFTNAWMHVLGGAYNGTALTYRNWLGRTGNCMPRSQKPTYTEVTEVSDAFRNGEAMR